MSYSGEILFQDMSQRIPPLWDFDAKGLDTLCSKHFTTHVEKRSAAQDNKLPVNVRFLELIDLAQLLSLHQKIIAALPDSQIFRSDDTSFLEANLDRRGRTVGAFIENQLIGYAVVSFPKRDTDNLGTLANIDKNEQLHVAHYDGAAVDPDYRGNSLHRFMNEIRGEYANLAGYHHLMGTVSPLNPYSLDNHLNAGFKIVNFAVKYEGMDRLIIHKSMANAMNSEQCTKENSISVSLIAKDKILELLDQGYRGQKVLRDEADFKVVFSK